MNNLELVNTKTESDAEPMGLSITDLIERSSPNADSLPDRLLSVAGDLEGNSLLSQPKGSRWSGYDVPPGLGCVATVSNLLLKAHPDFTPAHFEINVDKFEKTLRQHFDAYRLDSGISPQPGDFMVGRQSKGNGRHVGLVGPVEDGVQMIYHNRSGTLVKEPVDVAFEKYDQRYSLRIPH